MTTAIYLRAKNDPNGNPQRGWLVMGDEGITFYKEGHKGIHAVPKRYHNAAMDAPWIETTRSEYHRLVREYPPLTGA